jgi:hypothetical protein
MDPKKMKKNNEIREIKNQINPLKHKLITIIGELEGIGAVREANSLGTIIGKLEDWQAK